MEKKINYGFYVPADNFQHKWLASAFAFVKDIISFIDHDYSEEAKHLVKKTCIQYINENCLSLSDKEFLLNKIIDKKLHNHGSIVIKNRSDNYLFICCDKHGDPFTTANIIRLYIARFYYKQAINFIWNSSFRYEDSELFENESGGFIVTASKITSFNFKEIMKDYSSGLLLPLPA